MEQQVRALSAQGLTATQVARALGIRRREVIELLGGKGSVRPLPTELPHGARRPYSRRHFWQETPEDYCARLYDAQHEVCRH